LICKDPSLVKAEIHEWSDGGELEQVMMKLINMIIIEKNAQFISSDWKLQTQSISLHETMPKALSVAPSGVSRTLGQEVQNFKL
jgi:pyridoxal phosphate phosphatase PHOSPHO2